MSSPVVKPCHLKRISRALDEGASRKQSGFQRDGFRVIEPHVRQPEQCSFPTLLTLLRLLMLGSTGWFHSWPVYGALRKLVKSLPFCNDINADSRMLADFERARGSAIKQNLFKVMLISGRFRDAPLSLNGMNTDSFSCAQQGRDVRMIVDLWSRSGENERFRELPKHRRTGDEDDKRPAPRSTSRLHHFYCAYMLFRKLCRMSS